MVTAVDRLNKNDLIVITGAVGFIAGSLTRYFHDNRVSPASAPLTANRSPMVPARAWR
jgi:hypothetical protein